MDDWLSLGDVASHPMACCPNACTDGPKLTEPLTTPVKYDITVGLVYNGPDRTVQQFDDGSIAMQSIKLKEKLIKFSCCDQSLVVNRMPVFAHPVLMYRLIDSTTS